MVRTGARATALLGLLLEGGLRISDVEPPAPRMGALPPGATDQVLAVYRRLGGMKNESPRLRPGKWDLAFEGGVVVELDEELHFNRYRALTLSDDWTHTLPWANQYVKYCRSREADCIAAGRWGRRWTNPSCERLFGAADPPGVFDSGGAPRWKQRALYDMIKDAFAFVDTGIWVARLSVYDNCEGVEIGTALEGRDRIDPSALVKLVEDRLGVA